LTEARGPLFFLRWFAFGRCSCRLISALSDGLPGGPFDRRRFNMDPADDEPDVGPC
jgi:hypothetical protein